MCLVCIWVYNLGVVGFYRVFWQIGGSGGGKGYVDYVVVLCLIYFFCSWIVLCFWAIVDVQGSFCFFYVQFIGFYFFFVDIEDFIGVFVFGMEFVAMCYKGFQVLVVVGGVKFFLFGIICQVDEFVCFFFKGDKFFCYIVIDDFSVFLVGFGGSYQGSGYQCFIGVDRLVVWCFCSGFIFCYSFIFSGFWCIVGKQ